MPFKRNRRNYVWMAVLLSIVTCRPALARHDGDYLNKVTPKLKTPHLDWAKPSSRGRLKVLFVTPRTVAPREIIELYQRFDFDFDAFTIAHSGLLSFESRKNAAHYDLQVKGTSIAEKSAAIIAFSNQRYDAFVFANASLDVLPKEAQYKILKQVADGAGLLFTFRKFSRLPIFGKPIDTGPAEILHGFPLAGLDYFHEENILRSLRSKTEADLPGRIAQTFQFKKGRIAVLSWGKSSSTYYGGHGLTPPEPWSLHSAADYEAYLSLVYRALRWTVPDSWPGLEFNKLPADGSTFSRGELPRTIPLQLSWPGPRPVKVQLLARLRDRANRIVSRKATRHALGPGDSSVSINFPVVPAGHYFLDLIARTKAGVEQWASVSLNVKSSFAFQSFQLSSEFCERGQTVTGQASLSSPALPATRLRLSLTDTSGRLYSQQEIPIPEGGGEVEFKINPSRSRSMLTYVRGVLRAGNESVDVADRLLFVPRRNSNEFRSILWGGVGCGTTHLGWLAARQLRQAGFNAILSHPSREGLQERVLAACDFPLVCYAYRIWGGADDKGGRKDGWLRKVKDACFYNPALQQQARQAVLDRIRPVIPYGPIIYSLGDENSYATKSGFSPYGQQAFRAFLKQRYGSLESLNTRWGTQYANWNAVKCLPRKEATEQHLWPMIHEHLSFNEQEYADYHHFLSKVIKQADPHAVVGAEGAVPGDLEKTIEGLEVWGPYSNRRGNELLRSLAGPALVRGNWWGGYVGSHGARAGAVILWKQLFSGAVNTSLFFAAIGGEGLFATDLSFARYFEDMLPELKEIYGGIGQLIAASQVPDDGIAIHWSQANEHAATLFSELGSPTQSQGNLLRLLDNAGFGYRYVTTSQVEKGRLLAGKYRVLFLGCSQAVSKKEADAIRAFVENGGTVIADTAPGILDGICKPLWPGAGKEETGKNQTWKGQLDDVFGLWHTGSPAVKKVTGSLAAKFVGRPVTLEDFPFRLDASVQATGGDARSEIGGAPAFIVTRAGKGKTVFLNFAFPPPSREWPAFIRILLAGAGISPSYELENGEGYQFRKFRNGSLSLIGVARTSTSAGKAILRLARPACLYDVRAGKFFGKTSSVTLRSDSPAAMLFAALPSPAGKIKLTLNRKAAPGEDLDGRIEVAPNGDTPAGRILRIQFFKPDKSEAMPYRAYVPLKGRSASFTVPFALNDPKGRWTCLVTDIATGQKDKAGVRLK